MRSFGMIGGGIAAVAVLGMAVPAQAQHRRGPPPRHHHQGDRVDAGDVLLGAILAGGIIAIASSAEKKRREREAAMVDQAVRDYEADRAAADVEAVPEGPYGDAVPEGGIDAAPIDEEGAADRCAAAAENTGQGLARLARVTGVNSVTSTPQGAWTVRGTIELSDSYRASSGRRHQNFTCSLGTIGEPVVQIQGM